MRHAQPVLLTQQTCLQQLLHTCNLFHVLDLSCAAAENRAKQSSDCHEFSIADLLFSSKSKICNPNAPEGKQVCTTSDALACMQAKEEGTGVYTKAGTWCFNEEERDQVERAADADEKWAASLEGKEEWIQKPSQPPGLLRSGQFYPS